MREASRATHTRRGLFIRASENDAVITRAAITRKESER